MKDFWGDFLGHLPKAGCLVFFEGYLLPRKLNNLLSEGVPKNLSTFRTVTFVDLVFFQKNL